MDNERCPKCGSKNFTFGYGLAGGGIGTYELCDDCDYFHKTPDPDCNEETKEPAKG